jgi:hypothetical protein
MRPRKTARKYPSNPDRWSHDENKHISYEFKFKNTVVTPGMTLTLRHDRTKYRFICLVHDSRLDKTWIELLSDEGYKSARVERVTKVLSTVKRSRAKKQNV